MQIPQPRQPASQRGAVPRIAPAAPTASPDKTYDVAVMGGTAAGVTAAVAAARAGARTALVVNGQHVGGMVAEGLGNTDFGQREVIGGLARRFHQEVADHYGVPLWHHTGPEPKVAAGIMEGWLSAAGVDVIRGHGWLTGAELDGRRITSVKSQNGEVAARYWIDATYEGDLMAAAGVDFRVGRESRSLHGERWAGRQPVRSLGRHDFPIVVDPHDDSGRPLPLIHDRPMVPEGEGDGGVMGYGFRLTLSRADDRIPITKRPGYDPSEFELLRRYLRGLEETFPGRRPELRDVLGIGAVPGDKADVNSVGAISTMLLDGTAWRYPTAAPQERDAIIEKHRDYAHDLLYFLGTDDAVPANLREQVREWGLPRDEFTDNGGWPRQLYVREGRRMVGEHVLTEHDLVEGREPADSIGMGSYHIDIREVQRVVDELHLHPDVVPTTYNEGYVSAPVKPYGIPYRSIVPKAEQVENLLVPVAASASHVAYSSLRMEPQFMVMGEAAGAAAAMAATSGQPVQQVDVPQLRTRLREHGQVLAAGGQQP